jgi:predicted dehydrogenase
LRVAVIGVRGRGFEHLGGLDDKGNDNAGFLRKANNCEVVTICDCDEGVIARAMKAVEKAQGKPPRFEKDLRKVLSDPSIDVISIATPNHWHALAAIWAMQAGKHVYLEKPVSHNVWEGRQIITAARKLNKICQTGTQIRSMSGIRAAMEFLHAGKLGKVSLATGTCYKPRPSIGKVSGPQEPPKTMDYDLWCGPAPNKPPMRNTTNGPVHYDWHWVWDYGNGDLGNQGIHQMDVARWGLNKRELPRSVVSVGGRFGYVDDGQTANTQVCIYDYGDAKLIFEVRGLRTQDYFAERRGRPTDDKRLNTVPTGNIFVGEKGILVCSSYTDAIALDHDDKVIQVFQSEKDDDHYGNFCQAVRNNKVSELHADIEEGHLSSALCHVGNISYRLGREAPLASAETKSYGRDKDADDAIQRMRKHLEANGLKLDEVKCRMGVPLAIDAKAERFTDNAQANAMLTREYRKGFEVPSRL